MPPSRSAQLTKALTGLRLPESVAIRPFCEDDFAEIQRLSTREGWMTPTERPHESLASWRHAWPALVAVRSGEIIGFVRAITDGAITTYICELLVDRQWRGFHIGESLLAACHNLYPTTRMDLLAGEDARHFYEHLGCRESYGFRITRLV